MKWYALILLTVMKLQSVGCLQHCEGVIPEVKTL